MQKLFITALLAALCCSSFAQPTWQWGHAGGSATFGTSGYGPSEDIDDITTDRAGNVYIIGTVFNNVINIAGDVYPNVGIDPLSQAFIASFRCDGSLRWTKMLYGCRGKARAIKTDTLGGVYVTGWVGIEAGNGACQVRNPTTVDTTIPDWPNPINRNWFLMKFDTAGAYKWVRFPEGDTMTYWGGNSGADDMDVDDDGNCYILADMRPGAFADGAFVANHTGGWGADGNSQLYMMKYDRNGNFVSGYRLPFSFTGQGAPDKRFVRDKRRHRNIISGIDGYTAGDSLWIDNQKVYTMYVAAFDDSGNLLWLSQQDSAGQNGLIGTCVDRATLDKQGNIYLGGWAQNGYSFNGTVVHQSVGGGGGIVIKLDTAGHNLWIQHSENSGTVSVTQAVPSGDTVAAFGLYATTLMIWGNDTLTRPWNCGYRSYLALLNANTGAVIGVDSLETMCGANIDPSSGGNMIDGGTAAIAADRFGNFYMGGEFDYQLWLPGDTVNYLGGDDSWYLCKYGSPNCSQPIDSVLSVRQNMSNAGAVSVYPNPSTGVFTFSAHAALGQVTVYNLVGEKVFTATTSAEKLNIDLHGQAEGIYIYTINTSGNKMQEGKLILR